MSTLMLPIGAGTSRPEPATPAVHVDSPLARRWLTPALALAASILWLNPAQAQSGDCSCYRIVTNWHGTFTATLSGSGVDDAAGTFRFNNSSQGSFDCNGHTATSAITGSGTVDRLEDWGCDFLSYQGSGPLTAASIVSLFFNLSNCTYYLAIAEGITAQAWQHVCQDPDPPLDLHNAVFYSPSHGVVGVFPLPAFGQPLIGSITTNRPWGAGFLTLNASWRIDPIIDQVPPRFTSIPPGGPLGCNPATIPDDVSILGLASATAASGQVAITAVHADTLTGACESNRVFTLTAVDLCLGTVAHAAAVYTWTTDTDPPVFLEVPPGGSLGNDPATIPDDAAIKAQVRVVDFCGDEVVIEATHMDAGIPPQFSRTFTITATDHCLNHDTKMVVYTWTASAGLPPLAVGRSGANCVISWPSRLNSVVLQTTTNLFDWDSWQTILTEPTVDAGWSYVTNTGSSPIRFFRLRSP